MRGPWNKESDVKPRIRHLPFADSYGKSFGDHYVTNDKSLPTADQWTISVFAVGDNKRPTGDPFRDIPHVVISVWDGTAWHEASVTDISRQGGTA
ncbi:MAG TPA: hypothetical protein VGG75_38635 [Trebonia sp.]|jgi:hypothetical protein